MSQWDHLLKSSEGYTRGYPASRERLCGQQANHPLVIQTGKLDSESVASLRRNDWQVWIGISGKFASESVATLARNPQG